MSCSAAVHHCHLFYVSFSPFSAPSLSLLSSPCLRDVCSLGERLPGNDCSHFCTQLSIHSLHPSSHGWPRSKLISSFLCPLLPALLKHHRSSCCCLAQAAQFCHRETSYDVQNQSFIETGKNSLVYLTVMCF